MKNKEPKTGVSIHFVEESLYSGDIIFQKEYEVSKKDTFNSLVIKNYKLASKAIIEALEILENKEYSLIKNDCKKATYNSTPTLKEAWHYRFRKT
jgi:methionyl-tRNA formyltransferase